MSDLPYFSDETDPLWIDRVWLDTVVVVGLTCFVLCLMGLAKVSSAKMGMLYGICGMSALIVGFWVDTSYTYANGPWLIAVSMAPGAIIGLWSAYIVGMTSLPEMVGLYNGFGGFAAALTGYGQYLDPSATSLVRHNRVIADQTDAMLFIQAIALILSIVIGMMTFMGSMVAALKLHGLISSKSWVTPYRSFTTLVLVALMVVFGVLPFAGDQHWNDRGAGIAYLAIEGFVAGLYGYLAVMAIGGGDMPVSIAFLNSLSGFSTSAAGLMLNNKALVVSGAFVGCSGIILTLVMCNAMNRSVANVLLGGFGEGSKTAAQTKGPQSDDSEHGVVKEISAEDVVEILTSSNSVIVVPGYGMAVAKAQHSIKELTTLLRARGIMVRFAIHPVAGRMPGHMNVLLAEAQVPYDLTFSMDDINPSFPKTDAVLILGGNDIVNPGAQTDPNSPIAGMPVLEVWKAKQTIVMKRSLNVGYAGVENPLFLKENNAMYLGDAKDSTDKLVSLLRSPTISTKQVDEDAETHRSDVESTVVVQNVEKDDFLMQIPLLQEAAYLKVGIVKEISAGERKVAIVPDGAKRLLKAGIQVFVETGAGNGGDFYDSQYNAAGAKVLPTAQAVFDIADVIVKIREPAIHPVTGVHEINMLGKGKSLICFLGPRTNEGKALMEIAKNAGINYLAMDAIPRISRAQSLDVLTSQAKIAGYRAVLDAAHVYQKFLNGETTGAGNFPPSKILVVGAGVAGLAAIGAGTNLGAIVYAFDTRLETKEQVESLGGKFLMLDFSDEVGGDASGYATTMSDTFYQKEMAMFREQAKDVDFMITTAAIPGMKAPVLIQEEAVNAMKAGSVIVDLAGATGGNCALTRPGTTYVHTNGVTIIGSDMTNQAMAWQASTMYSNNVVNLFNVLCKDHKFYIDMEDQVIRGMTCVHEGSITFPPPESVTKTSAAMVPKMDALTSKAASVKKTSWLNERVFDLAPLSEFLFCIVAAVFFGIVAAYAPVSFMQQLGYFILSGFLGYYLIWNVEPALFSPLMSVSNAISGVVILAGMLMASVERGSPTLVLGCLATSVAAINVFGGFAISYRMLLMFRKELSG